MKIRRLIFPAIVVALCGGLIFVSNLGHFLGKRRFHLINLSLPKTGSYSLMTIFGNYRGGHDYMLQETVTHYLDWQEGKINEHALDEFLKHRDRMGNYEVDSPTFLYLMPDRVMANFPEAKFYISVRDGQGWILSLTEMFYNFYGPAQFLKTNGFDEAFVFRYFSKILPGFSERMFSDLETLHTRMRPMLPVMAEFWGKTSLAALKLARTLPRDKILLVQTKDISYSLDKMAAFVGVKSDTLDSRRTHMHPDFRAELIRKEIGAAELESAVLPWQKKVDAELKALGL